MIAIGLRIGRIKFRYARACKVNSGLLYTLSNSTRQQQYTVTNFKHFPFRQRTFSTITLFEHICLNNLGVREDVILLNLVHIDGQALSRVESSRIEALSDGKAHRQKHHGNENNNVDFIRRNKD